MRLAYRSAYWAARIWWFIRRPQTFGAVVALWSDGRILLVQASYRRCYALPGGFMKRGETARDAASRELAEELQLFIPPDALTLGWHGSRRFESREDTVTIWEIVLDAPPGSCGPTGRLQPKRVPCDSYPTCMTTWRAVEDT